MSLAAALAILPGACSGGVDSKAPETASVITPSQAPSITATGKTIVVEMVTDEKGSYFKPAKIEAHRGDLIRFTLGAGVHNVHFLADSNPGKQSLPAPSDFLQLPGQTYDLVVALEKGHYYFQCDPHALLGMIGYIEVEGD